MTSVALLPSVQVSVHFKTKVGKTLPDCYPLMGSVGKERQEKRPEKKDQERQKKGETETATDKRGRHRDTQRDGRSRIQVQSGTDHSVHEDRW